MKVGVVCQCKYHCLKYKMKENGDILSGSGYQCKDKNDCDMIKFHINENLLFTAIGNTVPFGGNLSVRNKQDDKQLIIFGQEKCIFIQYKLRNNCWNSPKVKPP